jgi:hypothetical protein
MNITDYIIDIQDFSLEDRLKLKQVLLDNGQKMDSAMPTSGSNVRYIGTSWCVGNRVSGSNISLKDFITKFGKQPLLHQKWKDLYDQGVELEIKHCLDSDSSWSTFDSDCGLSISFNEPDYEYRIKPQAKYELNMAKKTVYGKWYVIAANEPFAYLTSDLTVELGKASAGL